LIDCFKPVLVGISGVVMLQPVMTKKAKIALVAVFFTVFVVCIQFISYFLAQESHGLPVPPSAATVKVTSDKVTSPIMPQTQKMQITKKLSSKPKSWFAKQKRMKHAVKMQCPPVAPTFHGSSASELRFYDEMVMDSKAEPQENFMQTFKNGMVLVHQQSAAASHQPEYSAWSEKTGDVMLSSSHGNWLRSKEWVLPPAGPWLPDLTVTGPHAFIHSSFSGNYGHFMVNYMPNIAWMREQTSPNNKFLLISNPTTKSFIKWFDVLFYNRVVWIEPGQLVMVKGDLQLIKRSSYVNAHPSLINSFHRWSEERSTSILTPEVAQQAPSRVVYIHQRGKDINHGHILNELEVLQILRKSMKKHNRPEELFILDDAEMTLQQKFQVFHSAGLVIGPHDESMTNAVFLGDGASCAQRPLVLEFTCGAPECKVHGGGAHRSSFYQQATLPWANYHQVDYDARKSTAWVSYVNLAALQLALDSMWGAPPEMPAAGDYADGSGSGSGSGSGMGG
jgi:hypothetical protein